MRLTFASTLLLLTLPAFAGSPLKPAAVPEFLPVEQAFELQPLEWKNGQALVSWRVAPGYYLYRDRLTIEAVSPGLKLGAPTFPKSKTIEDEIFGTVEIYDTDLSLPLAASGGGTVKVRYQGCAKAGLCYPPQTQQLVLAAPK